MGRHHDNENIGCDYRHTLVLDCSRRDVAVALCHLKGRISHADISVLAGNVTADCLFDVGGISGGCSRVFQEVTVSARSNMAWRIQ